MALLNEKIRKEVRTALADITGQRNVCPTNGWASVMQATATCWVIWLRTLAHLPGEERFFPKFWELSKLSQILSQI